MEGWNVFFDSADFPGQYVTRRWFLDKQDGKTVVVNDPTPLYVGTSLADARRSVPFGSVCLGRDERDVPCLLEVWV